MTPEEIRKLPKSPKIDEANYGWTGTLGEHRCLLVGDRELHFDKALKTSILDTSKWLKTAFSSRQLSRSAKFHQIAGDSGSGVLIYVYEDIGTGLTVAGEHQAKRGSRKFVGWFGIREQGTQEGRGWMVALLQTRA